MIMKENDNINKAFSMWYSFKNEVLYKNRFFIKHEILEHIKMLAEKNTMIIKKERIVYRARIFYDDTWFLSAMNENFDAENKNLSILEILQLNNRKSVITPKRESGFWGYDAKDSYAPLDNNIIGEGRANPSYIKYLYTAEQAYTALVEVRPYLDEYVSIAEIEVIDDLSIADFTIMSLKDEDTLENFLMYAIMSEFSKPNKGDAKGYIPTQYIAEYLRFLGYEGIRFNSSLYKSGYNLTIFNLDKCKPINSKLYKTDEIFFKTKCMAPENGQGLIHPKLKPPFPSLIPFSQTKSINNDNQDK